MLNTCWLLQLGLFVIESTIHLYIDAVEFRFWRLSSISSYEQNATDHLSVINREVIPNIRKEWLVYWLSANWASKIRCRMDASWAHPPHETNVSLTTEMCFREKFCIQQMLIEPLLTANYIVGSGFYQNKQMRIQSCIIIKDIDFSIRLSRTFDTLKKEFDLVKEHYMLTESCKCSVKSTSANYYRGNQASSPCWE